MARGNGLHSVPRSLEGLGRTLACGLSPVQRARVADAMRATSAVRALADPDELFTELRERVDAMDLVVLGAHAGGYALEAIVKRVRLERPQLPIVVYLGGAPQDLSTIPGLTQAGVHEILLVGYNDEGARLRSAVTSARRNCAARWVLSKLSAIVPPRLMPFAEAIATDPANITSVPALAARVGVHRKTLYNWCQLTRFVPPAELLAWCRLAMVAYYLENTRCSVDTIARDLEYPSDTALRNHLKRYTRLTATQLRANEPLERIIKSLRGAVARQRGADPSAE